ncbi:MAG: peptidoglycan DD-metalloendopeptidase family protein [Deltaproteobacteria bacterium]|nr:peptidoglycan DD-metalloendopeptidase family protein [Deltaproteobacteria bacterium]
MDNKINSNNILQKTLQNNPQQEKRALEKAASEFESLFIFNMLKTMRKSVSKESLFGNSKGEEIYKSMLDEELSRVMAQGRGMGLRDMIVRDLSALSATEGKGDTPDKAAESFNVPSVYGVNEKKGIRPLSEDSLRRGGERLPVKGEVSSLYGFRKDFATGDTRFHHGIDITAPEGSPVSPVASGVVTFSGVKPDFGNMVEVEHDDGSLSIYGHNKGNMVSLGERVERSDIIALVGKSGRALEPHLHFEIRMEGYSVNPAEILSFG